MEPDDMILEAVARLSEEVWDDELDPDREVERLQGMVASAFWTRRNELIAAWTPEVTEEQE